jgi:ATP/maltotriose-dependent transcriptional regulator MalT/DNA-binding SARP family transcriptional activator
MNTIPLPLINTKIRIPQRPKTLVRRERLLNFIHSNIQMKLIMVSAGAGYGKTSLLIDYAHDTDLPVCWLTLDASDGYVPTFIEYLVAAIHARFPQFGERVLAALYGYHDPAESIEPFVRLLIDELEQVVDQYMVIILDNYHEVLNSEPVNALVNGLIRYLPEQCHIIVASRGIPRRLLLSQFASRQEVAGLGVKQLCFTEDEIRLVLDRLGRGDLSPEQIQQLAERSEGWITGILLAAQTSWTDTTQEIIRLSGSNEVVFEYLADEVLDRQAPYIRRFLLESALLAEMSPPMCDALLEITDSAQVLAGLFARNLFTLRLDGEGAWYQYHQLFREFLVAKLERDDPGLYRRLNVRRARLMTDQGHWPQAIESYLAARAYQEAADAIEIAAPDLFAAGERAQLGQWIDDLPESVRQEHPMLLLRRGRIHVEAERWEQAEPLLERAYRTLLEREDMLGASRALVQRGIAYRLQGRLDEALATCKRVFELGGERDPLSATQAHHTLGICYHMQGDSERGEAQSRRALEIAQAQMDDTNAAFIAHDLGNMAVQRGHLERGRQHFHQALLHWRKSGNSINLAMTMQSLGVLHQYLGQYAEAQHRFEESLARVQDHDAPRLQAYALLNQGDLARDTNQYDRAAEAYRAAAELAASASITSLILYAQIAQADLCRLRGDGAQASRILVETMDQINEARMPYEAALCRLALGALRGAQGDVAAAKQSLSSALALFERLGLQRELARTHLHLALLAYTQNPDQTPAIEREMRIHLGRVAGLRQELGTAQFIVAEGPTVIPLLQYGIDGLDSTRIRAEIERLFPSAQTPARLRVVQGSYPLEFLGLQGGRVLVEGKPVTHWESAVAREMAFLLATYPEGLGRDRIIDMLWPEIAPAKATSQFYATMHRARKALGAEAILHDHSLYRLGHDGFHRYDVAEFQGLAKLGRGDSESAHIARVQALQLYQSDFLEASDQEWADTLRRNLRMQMVSLLDAEAEYLVQLNQLAEAESLFLRMLGFDALDERAHRGVMLCRAKRSDKGGALRQFRECARILREELQVEPSLETMALYRAIGGGQLLSALA